MTTKSILGRGSYLKIVARIILYPKDPEIIICICANENKFIKLFYDYSIQYVILG